MATKLEKNLTRESSSKAEDREIMITITADQKVSMKLKGMKSGEVNISIEELWHQLNGTDPEGESSSAKSSGAVTISRSTPKAGKNKG